MRLLLACFLLASSLPACAEPDPDNPSAGNLPPGWPWHGVLIQSCCDATGPDDIRALAQHGASAVVLNIKVPMHVRRYKETPEQGWRKSLAWVNTMLDACREQHITGIVRLNQLPLDPDKQLHQWTPDFWSDRQNLDDVLTALGRLSTNLSTRGPELGAYIVLSEPVTSTLGIKHTPSEWPAFQLEIIDKLRQNDPNRFVVVTPGPGGSPSGYKDYEPLPRSNLVYGAHVYAPHAYTHQGVHHWKDAFNYPGKVNGRYWDKEALAGFVKPLRDFETRYNVPVFIGEFSVIHGAPGDERYLTDLIDILDSYSWGWAYFLYRGNPIWNIGDPGVVSNTNNRGKPEFIDNQADRWRFIVERFRSASSQYSPQ